MSQFPSLGGVSAADGVGLKLLQICSIAKCGRVSVLLIYTMLYFGNIISEAQKAIVQRPSPISTLEVKIKII